MSKCQQIVCTGIAAVLVYALAAPAGAQNALGDGHALDGNLQHGSGGRNSGGARDQRLDFRTRNDLITGNVTGSEFFRDRVDHFSPGEFQDSTGGDDLFRFRAETAHQGSPAMLSSGSYGINRVPRSVFRDVAPISAGAVRANQGDVGRLFGSRGLDGSVFDAGSLTGTALDIQPRDFTRIGVVEGADGRLLDVTASPLTGIEMRRPELPRLRRPETDSRLERMLDPRLLPERPALEPGFELAPDQGEEEDVLPEWSQSYHGHELPAAIELGRQLQRLQEATTEEERQAAAARSRAVEQGIYGPLERFQTQPGDDVYLDIVRNMRQRSQTDSELRPGDPFESEIRLEKPSAEQIEAAEQARRAALKARGLTVPEEVDEEIDDEAARTTDRLVQALDASGVTVESMAGNRQTMTNRLLAEAEAALAAGRYFDAEKSYRRVLQVNPRYPLARIGMVHAQLGAGLVRSAAGNLREVFNAHPELIAVHYEAKLLPNEDRLIWARGELESMIDRTNRQEPALLLAYLGYQTANKELVRYGLARAEARQPGDSLIGLLRRIWLSDHAAPRDAEPSPQTTPQPTPESGATPADPGK